MSFCTTGCGKKDAPDQDTRLTVAVIPKGTIHEFWKTVHAGAEMAGRELGVETIWKGSLKEDDREAQISVVENIMAKQSGRALSKRTTARLRSPSWKT
jgi:ribose transport system substrate-binding protein